MKAEGRLMGAFRGIRRSLVRARFAIVLIGLLAGYTPAPGGEAISLESPIGFFTNVAGRLLRSELNLDLNRIPIYPTNCYTPAVHRLLQVTANIYDSATNRTGLGYPELPSVFRPLFRRDPSGMVYVAGYREVINASLVAP